MSYKSTVKLKVRLFLLSSYFLCFFFYSSFIPSPLPNENIQKVEQDTNTPTTYNPPKPRISSTSRKGPYYHKHDIHNYIDNKVFIKVPFGPYPFLRYFIDFLFRHLTFHSCTSPCERVYILYIIFAMVLPKQCCFQLQDEWKATLGQ